MFSDAENLEPEVFYTSAAYRRGLVVDAKTDTGSPVQSDIYKAREIGREIHGSSDRYLSAIYEGLQFATESFLDNHGLNRSSYNIDTRTEEYIAARFAPGLIIDFPKFDVTLNAGELKYLNLSSRCCVTVCSDDARSKIWTRVVIKKMESQHYLSLEQLKKFQQLAEGISTKLNEIVRAQYQIDMSTTLSMPIRLEALGTLHVFAADCQGDVISNEIEEWNGAVDWSDRPIYRIQGSAIPDAMSTVAGLTIPREAWATEDDEFYLRSGASFFPYTGKNGAESMFVSYSDAQNGYLTGIVSDNEIDNHDNAQQLGPYGLGTGTTAEVAFYIGSKY